MFREWGWGERGVNNQRQIFVSWRLISCWETTNRSGKAWEHKWETLSNSSKAGSEDSAPSSVLVWTIPWIRSLAGYRPWGHRESDTTEKLNTHMHTHARTHTCAHTRSCNPTPGHTCREKHGSKGDMHPNVHCSAVYNGQDMEATWMSINRWMDKDVVHIYNEMLRSHKMNEIMPFAATWMDLEGNRLEG